MNKFVKMLALVCLSSAVLVSCDSTSGPGTVPGRLSESQFTDSPDEVYQVNQTTRVVDPIQHREIILNSGDTLNIIETDNSKNLVRVGVDVSSDDTIVDMGETFDIWLDQSDLENMNVTLIDEEDPYDFDGNEIEGLSSEEQSYLRKKMTYCYRYVKKYLLKHGLVKVYLPGASAWMAASILPKHGFKKVTRKPASAIVHDVCVYKGGPSGHGHIEVKTSQGWYYGYGYKSSPIKNRIFIGCFHK